MRKKPKQDQLSQLRQSFSALTITRENSLFLEISAVENLTGRAVDLFLFTSEVMSKKSDSETKDFLHQLGTIARLPHVAPLLRADRLSDSSLLLVFETQGDSLANALNSPENRTFEKVSNLFIQLLVLVHRVHALGAIHGELGYEVVAIDAAHQPSVRGFGLLNFAQSGIPSQRPPSDSTPPELIVSGEPTIATDIYGIASIIFVALTGYCWTDDFPNTVDAILSKYPKPGLLADSKQRLWKFAEPLLAKEPERRPKDLLTIALDINNCREEFELPRAITGESFVDSVTGEASTEGVWGEITNLGSLDFSGFSKKPSGTTEDLALRDSAERSLSVQAVDPGRRPNVISVHRKGASIADERPNTPLNFTVTERDAIVLEEWRPEKAVDAWTVPADDVAAVTLCTRGHRVSLGSKFCNFCGEPLAPAENPRITSKCLNGHELPIGTDFCNSCDIDSKSTVREDSRSTRKGKGTKKELSDVRPVGSGLPVELDPIIAELDTSVCIAGHPNLRSASECRECGGRIVNIGTDKSPELPEPESEIELTFCPNGHPNRDFARFCRWCAVPLGSSTKPPAFTPPVPAVHEPVPASGLPGRPFVLSATDPAAGADTSIIFTPELVVPVVDESDELIAIARRREPISATKKPAPPTPKAKPSPTSRTGRKAPVKPASVKKRDPK